MKKIAKERVIFDNYDIWKLYPDETIREMLHDNGIEDEDITDKMIEDERYFSIDCDWDNAKSELEQFFDGKKLLIFGSIGRWNGVVSGFDTFDDFMKMFYWATEDCDYWKFYDENGHLYLHCSHHDGSCTYEIKLLTDVGYEYLDRWNYSWNDKRKSSDLGKQLVERYSRLPHFSHNVYGCKRVEYEPITKEGLVRVINNKAKSFYC